METSDPLADSGLATKADHVEVRAGIELAVRVESTEVKKGLPRWFVCWLFISQAGMVAIGAVLFSAR